MTIKIIGAGFGRTGTLSVKAALEDLGFGKCYHMSELIAYPEQVVYWETASQGQTVDWDTLFKGYQATIDFPGHIFYQEIMAHYPQAKVLLTVRDPEAWYASALETIYRTKPNKKQKISMAFKLPFSSRLRHLMRVFKLSEVSWERKFQDKFEDKAYAIKVFEQHNEEVKQIVPANKLLIYNVKEGWEPLCNFLQVPVPENKSFPHLNDREAFKRRINN